MVQSNRAGRWRTRTAAAVAAAVVAGSAGSLGLASATITSGERPAFVAITPCRLVDTRPATPLGAGQTVTVRVTGTNGRCTIPAEAVSVASNITAAEGTAQSFLTAFPAGTTRPHTSNLNWMPGQPATPNQVTVGLGDGAMSLYNNLGSVDVIIDLVGYFQDHNHDDRYYTEAESDARYYTKEQADARFAPLTHTHDDRYYTKDQVYSKAEVYNRQEADAQFLQHDDMTTSQGGSGWRANYSAPSTVESYASYTRVSGDGLVQQALVGPQVISGMDYRPTSVEYCVDSISGGGRVDSVGLWRYTVDQSEVQIPDGTDRTGPGCYVLPVPGTLSTDRAFDLTVQLAGGSAARVALGPVTVVWSPDR